MEYVIGLLLAAGVAVLAGVVGFDRDRAFYPTVVIIVASYYILFAAMGGSGRILAAEIAVACIFTVVAILGYKLQAVWLMAAALIGHGLFDSVHHLFISNPGMPRWWPGFCMSFDVALGALLALRLLRHPRSA
jgi:hypothetical protein